MQSQARPHFVKHSSLMWIFWFLAAVAIPLSSVRAGEPLTAETPRMIGPGPRVHGESLPEQKSQPAATPEQFERATPEAPPRIMSIEGINFDEDAANNTDSSGVSFYHIPPDPHGAAGPRHLVSIVNTSIEWFTKAGVAQHSQRLGRNATIHVGSFFEPLTPVNDLFDPKVIYDQHNDRFVVVALEQQDTTLGDPVNSSRILLAVSDDSDPNGNWHYLAINSRLDISGAARWADYPGFAVGEEAVYVTANMFSFGNNAFGGVRLWIIAKGAGSGGFYDGGAASVTVHNPYASGGSATTTQPAHMYGTGPAGVGTFLVSYSGLSNGINEFVQVVRVDNPLSGPTFSRQNVAVGDIDNTALTVPGAPQAGTTNTIDSGDRRAINAVWRNGSLWLAAIVVPGVGADSGQATAHWWQIDTTTLGSLVVTQQGNVGGEDIAAGAHTFYPAVAVDGSGNMGIGFAASAPTIFPGAYYTGRLSTDAAGTVQPSSTLAAGVDFYFRSFNEALNRWGDFSAITIDPSDDATFWVFNQYALARGTVLSQFPDQDGRWGTRFGSFIFRSLVNDLVLGFVPEPQSFETILDTSGCPSGFVGKFLFTATLAAKQGSPPVSNLVVRVNQLTNNNLLQNADGGPGGVGALLTIPTNLDPEYNDGILTYPENIRDIPFTICLTSRTRFTFLVDVLGTIELSQETVAQADDPRWLLQ